MKSENRFFLVSMCSLTRCCCLNMGEGLTRKHTTHITDGALRLSKGICVMRFEHGLNEDLFQKVEKLKMQWT